MAEDSPSARRRRHADRQVETPSESEEDNSWLLVYLDVITLLLIVFVVILNILDPDPDEEPPGEGPLDGQPAILEGDPGVLDGMPKIQKEAGEPVKIPKSLQEQGIEAVGEEDTLSFRLDDAVLFGTAEAELQPSGREAIDELVPIFQATGARISIEGHTDNRPITTEQFPSNWELSAARASAVLRYLNRQGIKSERMRAIGYADIRPLASNDTAEGRAKNRRVEITLHFGAEQAPEDLPTQ